MAITTVNGVTVYSEAPVDLHPEVMMSIEGVSDETRSWIEGPSELFRKKCEALEEIAAAREAVMADPAYLDMTDKKSPYGTINATGIVKIAEFAERKIAQINAAYDATHATLKKQITFTQSELVKPLEGSAGPQGQEIRSILRGMKEGERRAAMSAAINDGDKVLVSSMLGAHPVQSGLSPLEVQMFTKQWHLKTQPQLAARLAVLERAFEILGERAHTMANHAQKLIGKTPQEVAALRQAAARTAKAFAR